MRSWGWEAGPEQAGQLVPVGVGMWAMGVGVIQVGQGRELNDRAGAGRRETGTQQAPHVGQA